MRTNIAAGGLSAIFFAMSVNMPLTMFMEAIGVGGALIGLLTAVRQFVTAVQIPSALISEHLGARKKFWALTTLPQRLLWLAIAGPGAASLDRLLVNATAGEKAPT